MQVVYENPFESVLADLRYLADSDKPQTPI